MSTVYSALRAGASGFLLKSISPAELLHAISVIAAGDALLAPSVTRRLVGIRPDARGGPARRGREGRTRRHHRPGTGGNRARRQRAVQHRDRPPPGHHAATTKTHVGHLLAKLGARDRVHLVILAYQAGIAIPGWRPAANRPVSFG